MTRWTDARSYEALHKPGFRLTFGEKLVLFFRLNGEQWSFYFALASIALLVAAVVAAFVGLGR